MNSPQTQVRSILRALQLVLKQRGIQYATLARRLKLSESAIKKLFSKGTCSMDRLVEICGVTGVTLPELVELAYGKLSERSQLSPEQEDLFIRDLNKLHFFVSLVIHRLTVEEIKDRYRLDDRTTRRYLAALEGVRLIEIHPGDRVKPLVQEPISFSSELRDRYFDSFLREVAGHIATPSVDKQNKISLGREWLLSEESLSRLVNSITALLKEIDDSSARDRVLGARKLAPVSLAIAGVCREPLVRSLA